MAKIIYKEGCEGQNLLTNIHIILMAPKAIAETQIGK